MAHPARVYDYWLGGKDNFAADREAAERVLAAAPGLRFRARANRAFLGRTTRYLAAKAGIRQFLDIGTGIPTATTRTRSPSGRPPMPGWSTSTTTVESLVVHTRAGPVRLPGASMEAEALRPSSNGSTLELDHQRQLIGGWVTVP